MEDPEFILHPLRNGKRQLERLVYPRFLVDISEGDIEAFKRGEAINIENPIMLEDIPAQDFMQMARIMREAGEFVNRTLGSCL